MLKFRKNDEVLVRAGKDKGKRGKIDKTIPRLGQVVVGGVNLVRRHLKAQGKSGGIVEIAKPLSLAKVALICPKCQQPTRAGWRDQNNDKVRFCKKCQEVF